jgi:hypothetical protein
VAGLSLGHIRRRHGGKVHPWLVRLIQASKGLDQEVRSRNKLEALRSVEDVAFWQGRVICDLLGAEGFHPGVSSAQVGKAFLVSNGALSRARRFLSRA